MATTDTGSILRFLLQLLDEAPPSLTRTCAAIDFEKASPFAQATRKKSMGRRRLCLCHRLLGNFCEALFDISPIKTL